MTKPSSCWLAQVKLRVEETEMSKFMTDTNPLPAEPEAMRVNFN